MIVWPSPEPEVRHVIADPSAFKVDAISGLIMSIRILLRERLTPEQRVEIFREYQPCGHRVDERCSCYDWEK